MKKIAFLLSIVGLLTINAPASAVTLSGTGCNVWGLATYLFVNEGSSLVLINGGACFVNNPTGDEAARLASVVSQAQASGRQVSVGTGASQGGGNATGLTVAMQ